MWGEETTDICLIKSLLESGGGGKEESQLWTEW